MAAFFLHCLILFFPYLGTLCSCERTHVRSDILLASPPQCPLPFLPLALFLCFTALSCLFLPSTPEFPLRPPCLFPFSPLAAHSLVTPISHFHLILLSLSFPFVFNVHALSHAHDSVTLSLSSARGALRLHPPLLPPPPPTIYHYALPLSLSHPYPLFSLPLAHSLAPAVVLPPPPSRWCGERERKSKREGEGERVCVWCVLSLLSVSAVGRWRMEPQPHLSFSSALPATG